MPNLKEYLAILLLIIASSSPLFSQQLSTLTILGKESNTPVPFAIVSNLEKTKGGYANEEGVFDLAQNEVANQDTLVCCTNDKSKDEITSIENPFNPID